jgi:hypothetical protein
MLFLNITNSPVQSISLGRPHGFGCFHQYLKWLKCHQTWLWHLYFRMFWELHIRFTTIIHLYLSYTTNRFTRWKILATSRSGGPGVAPGTRKTQIFAALGRHSCQ